MSGSRAAAPAAPPRAAPLADPRWGAWALAIVLLVIAASATSLRNGFTYDDRWIVVENEHVHSLRALWRYFSESYWPSVNGGSLYRPLVTIAYSLQWVAGGGTPFVFHLVNVVLAAACAVAVFWVLGFYLRPAAAWLAAALFAVHPVHVEAIANVVGQAELWSALIVLLGVGLYARDRREGALRRETGVMITALFLVGIFAKEHVVAMPALLVVAELLLYDDAPLWQRLRRLRLLLWPMVTILAGYLAVRYQVLGEIGGDIEHPSLMHQTMLQRAFIMLDVIPEYGRLMLWPERLYADYSPRQLVVYGEPAVSQLQGAVLLVCTLLLFLLMRRRAPVVAFGIAWFAVAVAPVANILLPTGILVAERTLFLPSVGAMAVVATALITLRDQLRAQGSPLHRAVPVIAIVLLVLGTVRSSTRNAFWHDSRTAFLQMADDAPMNFKAHYALGGYWFEQRKPREGELEWRVAIALMPTYHGVYVDLGHRLRTAHLCGAAIPIYQQALAVEPDLPIVQVSIAACQLELARYRDARTTSRVAIADGMYKKAFRFIIDRADSALVATDSIDPTIGPKWLQERKGKP